MSVCRGWGGAGGGGPSSRESGGRRLRGGGGTAQLAAERVGVQRRLCARHRGARARAGEVGQVLGAGWEAGSGSGQESGGLAGPGKPARREYQRIPADQDQCLPSFWP